MSRTYKDIPKKYINKEEDFYKTHIKVEHYVLSGMSGLEYISFRYLERNGAKTKKKRQYYENSWMKTPMWWIHDMMTVPQRAKNSIWEKNVVKMNKDDLIDADPPYFGRKPHIYFW